MVDRDHEDRAWTLFHDEWIPSVLKDLLVWVYTRVFVHAHWKKIHVDKGWIDMLQRKLDMKPTVAGQSGLSLRELQATETREKKNILTTIIGKNSAN
jgi:hypothetical protein